MKEDRSKHAIVQSGIDVKSWHSQVPSVEVARPGQCPSCEAASRPPGGRLGLHGHGLRERQQRGPLTPGGPPTIIVLCVRRYRCAGCHAVVTVVPCGVITHRLFSGAAIADAVALFGLCRESPAVVRRKVSPWSWVGPTAAAGWASLWRWLRAIEGGRLFARLRRPAPCGTLRSVAEQAGAALAAFAPAMHSARPLHEQAFFGGAAMA